MAKNPEVVYRFALGTGLVEVRQVFQSPMTYGGVQRNTAGGTRNAVSGPTANGFFSLSSCFGVGPADKRRRRISYRYGASFLRDSGERVREESRSIRTV